MTRADQREAFEGSSKIASFHMTHLWERSFSCPASALDHVPTLRSPTLVQKPSAAFSFRAKLHAWVRAGSCLNTGRDSRKLQTEFLAESPLGCGSQTIFYSSIGRVSSTVLMGETKFSPAVLATLGVTQNSAPECLRDFNSARARRFERQQVYESESGDFSAQYARDYLETRAEADGVFASLERSLPSHTQHC